MLTFLTRKSQQLVRSAAFRCHGTQMATAGTTSRTLPTDVITSAENRERCMDCMKRAPPIGIKTQQPKRENALAAVLIAICINGDEASILYTRRSIRLSRHKRQISFPGGYRDATDVDHIDCALRETEEEIGLPRQRVHVWGTGALVTPPHTAAIMPVIGVINDFDVCELNVNEHEVEEAFAVPLAKLAEPDSLRHTQFKSGYSSPTFLVDDYRIWGITGFLTNTFLNCLLPPDLNKLKRRVQYIKPYPVRT